MGQSIVEVRDRRDLPIELQRVERRITKAAINCDVRFVDQAFAARLPKWQGAPGQGACNQAESEAGAYYRALGCRAVKLGSVLTGTILYEHGRDDASHAHERLLKEIMSPDDFRRFYYRAPEVLRSLALNQVPPALYPIYVYPPDFLVAESKDCFFAEVKGPRDSIHASQVNWFLNVKPADWRFEMIAMMQAPLDAVWLYRADPEVRRRDA